MKKILHSHPLLTSLLLLILILLWKPCLLNENSFASTGQQITNSVTNETEKISKDNNNNNFIIDATVIAAIIAALASLSAAILSGFFGSRNQNKLKELEKIRKHEDALLDYQYEARKRLYKEFEPLLFQLYELSGRARKRILHIARDSSQGNIQPHIGWLYNEDSYNTTITLYILLAPLSIFKLMQYKLTLFDLTLNSDYNNHYFIAKALYRSFLHDYKLANIDPELDYHPEDIAFDDSVKKNNPKKYRKQGLYSGILDTVTDALIIRENIGSENTLRILNYGEFLDKYFKKKELQYPFSNISYLLYNFHPETHPVLWRILVAQAFIYRLIIETYKKKHQPISEIKDEIPNRDISNEIFKMLQADIKDICIKFDWRSKEQKENIPLIKVEEPIKAVKDYLRDVILKEYQKYWK